MPSRMLSILIFPNCKYKNKFSERLVRTWPDQEPHVIKATVEEDGIFA